MTGMEHTIEQVRQAMQDAMNTYGPFSGTDQAQHVYDYLHALGLLAPAPLTEEWAAIDDDGTVLMRYGADSHSPHREYGTSLTYSRWASDWKLYGDEGDGRADH